MIIFFKAKPDMHMPSYSWRKWENGMNVVVSIFNIKLNMWERAALQYFAV